MATKIGLIVAGIAGVAALGTGGYFANEWRVCSGLEEDYLNSVASIRGYASINQVLNDRQLLESMKAQEDAEWNRLETTLYGLSSRCGTRAANTASRKGQDILLGTQQP